MEIEARKLTVASGKMQNGMYAKQNRRFIENRGEEAYGGMIENTEWNLGEQKQEVHENSRRGSLRWQVRI